MRITNSMMINNAILTLNRNEEQLTMLDAQMNTGKKIQRPSDDPVIAARTLKLRTTVGEIAQYKTNAEDAKSWLDVTEKGIANIGKILTQMREKCTQGATSTLNAANRDSIISELEQLTSQIINEGNVSYAGRYVFSGYRTGTTVSFQKECKDEYEITEHLKGSDMETITKTIGDKQVDDISRIRLGYSNVSFVSGSTLKDYKGADIPGYTLQGVKSTDANAYQPAEGTVNVLEDTGEIIFNKLDADKLKDQKINFTYKKDEFKKDDLRPEMYFDCKNITENVTYNKYKKVDSSGIETTDPNQIDEYRVSVDDMNYEISYSQKVQVNTMAHDAVTVDFVRDMEELMNQINGINDDDTIEDDLKQDQLQDSFSKMLTKLEGHLDKNLKVRSKIGSDISRTKLTINRIEEDKVTFTELLSKNEDVNMYEAFMKWREQLNLYNAALSSSSKIIQPTLIDFIR